MAKNFKIEENSSDQKAAEESIMDVKKVSVARSHGGTAHRVVTEPDPLVLSVYYSLRPIFTVSMLLGMTPLSNVWSAKNSDQLSFRWLSFPALYSLLVVAGLSVGTYLTTTSYSYIMNTQQDINDVVLSLTGPIFYWSNLLSTIQCINVSRKLPELFQRWDEVAVRLSKYMSPSAAAVPIMASDDRSCFFSCCRITRRQGIHLGRTSVMIVFGFLAASAVIEHVLHDFNLPVHLCHNNYTNYFQCYLIRGNEAHFNDALGHSVPFAVVFWVVQKYANVAWNFHDIFLVVIALAIRANFKVIAEHVRDTHRQPKGVKEWRTIREDHLALIDLMDSIDKVFSLMFLQSYGTNLFFLCLQVSLSVRPMERTDIQMAYFVYSLYLLIVRICGVSAAATSVNEQAVAPLQYLFDCPTNTYCTEVYRFTSHLMNLQVGFTGFEFFVVDRRIFLALISVIITYELILLKIS